MSSVHDGRNTSEPGALSEFSSEAPPQTVYLPYENPLDAFLSERDQLTAPQLPPLESLRCDAPIIRDAKLPRGRRHSFRSSVATAITLGRHRFRSLAAMGITLGRHSLRSLAATGMILGRRRFGSLIAAGITLAASMAVLLGVSWRSPVQLKEPAAIPAASLSLPVEPAPGFPAPSIPESRPAKSLAASVRRPGGPPQSDTSSVSRQPDAQMRRKSPMARVAPAERKRLSAMGRNSSNLRSSGTSGSPGDSKARLTAQTPPTRRTSVIGSPPAKVADAGTAPRRNRSESPALPAVPSLRAPEPERRESAGDTSTEPGANPEPPAPGAAVSPRRADESSISGGSTGERVVRAAPRDEDDVRTVLSRYRSAYERLDAGAAKKIWPSLNERALARAFEGLESQDVEFSDCRLAVTGSRAQASCTGTARYVKRVGSKSSRPEPRQWTFKLKKESNTWQIDTVQTR